MSYTYQSFQQALATEMVIPQGINDPNFTAILPTIIDYAEQRIYRELDCEHASVQQLFTCVPFIRSQSILLSGAAATPPPGNQLLIVERVLILPVGWTYNPTPPSQPTSGGEPIKPTTMDVIDAIYSGIFPAPGVFGPPTYFAMQDDLTVVFGPAPDKAYMFLVFGKNRPTALYNLGSGDSSFLTSVLPDLFLAASMIAASAYRKNFGAASDDPRSAMSWEQQFQLLLPSAKSEENRKRFAGWNDMSGESSPKPQGPP